MLMMMTEQKWWQSVVNCENFVVCFAVLLYGVTEAKQMGLQNAVNSKLLVKMPDNVTNFLLFTDLCVALLAK